jgi:ABC-type Na+ efflux pump permease subunit
MPSTQLALGLLCEASPNAQYLISYSIFFLFFFIFFFMYNSVYFYRSK